MKRFLLLAFLFFITILEFSFFPAAFPFIALPNFLMVFVILYNLLENPSERKGMELAFVAGLVTDIFTGGFIGVHAFVFLTIAYLLKYVLSKYVQLSFLGKI